MLSKIPDNIKQGIIDDIKDKFHADIEEDLIDFLINFQSKIAVDEGFAKKETVRLYNLAVFRYNPKKLDSKNTMVRLLAKHDGDNKAALKEFRKLGKELNLEERRKKKEAKKNKVVKPKKHAPIKSINGGFVAR